ncbi:hypothetical protein DYI24_14900 [Rhodopseudomonas sp. BR0C11]|uniref:hypothetical protein n=1 Tax=Rhodopseudomonas sp. BR0C11 TaxID=2269370 RepID=UPI0013DE9DB8|nr:hypothetical protein [Rhodopseudomonas sp. BR0C11]NEV78329.1 hypothetical protein [Rhodopseudomonas sp. BR0C11]
MKEKLLAETSAHVKAIIDLQRRVGRYSGAQVQSGSLLSDVKAVASSWFDTIKSALEGSKRCSDHIPDATAVFDKLLRMSKTKPRKAALLTEIGSAIAIYKEIVHSLETATFAPEQTLSITPFIEGLAGSEIEYLDEAQRCLTVNALRACVVLGWCAVISRVQRKIEELGYDTFTKASKELAGKTTGRFKWVKKSFVVESRSDLQTVFDSELLWVLEYMELIDGNQHGRLRHCFEFRNNSAHPGLAEIKGPNLYSFYSDISEIVFKNPKFALASG